jgi:PEP-CTERM motif
MKISRICALFLLVMVASALAFGDGIHDPKVIVHGANGGGDSQCGRHNCMDVGLNFSFQVPKSGSGALYFTNTSGKDWTSLALIEKGVPAADINCAQSLFLTCTVKTLKNGSVEILLAGIHGGDNPRTGIRNGQSFSIKFACNPSCWPGGLTIGGHAGTGVGTVPEPGTIALMVTGLGAMVSRRKRWKNRFNG